MPNPLLDMVMSGGPASAGPSMPMPNPGAAQGSSNPLLDMVLNGSPGADGNAPPPMLGQQGPVPASAPSAQPAQPQQPMDYWDELKRQAGLTVRAGVKGALALPGMAADAVSGVYNGAADAVAGPGNGFRFQTTQQALDNVLTGAGVPQPKNGTERVVQDATAGMAGIGALSAAGRLAQNAVSPTAKALGDVLRARPVVTTVSGATGPGAAAVSRENGGSPSEQLAIALLGSATPAVAADSPRAIARLLTGGKSAAQISQTMDDFAAAGTTPSLGQATQSRTARALESTLSRVPGGAGPMAAKAENTASSVGTSVGKLADDLAPGADSTSAGMAITKGVKGDDSNSFLSTFRATQEQLYDKLDQFIPASAPVTVTNTKQALSDLNQDIKGAATLSQFFKNGKIQDLQGALEADTAGSPQSVHVYGQPAKAGGGIMNAPVPQDTLKVVIPPGPPTNTLPFEAVKKLRTLVGKELSEGSLLSDVPRSKWQALYGALSNDIGGAAEQAGPDAAAAWSRANTYTRAGMDRLGLLDSVVNQQTPERIFNAAVSGTREGATTIRAVMKSIPETAQKEVTASFLNRMGQAAPGAQNDTGSAFSIQTFLTNWAKLSPEARLTLFNRPGYDAEFGKNLDKIARVASNLREGSKVFANPSGTAQAVTLSGALGSALAALATGHPAPAGGILAAAGSANMLARAVTSPTVVKWLAGLSDSPMALVPAQVNALSQMAGKEKDPTAREVASHLQATVSAKKSLRQTISDALEASAAGTLEPAIR